MIANVMKNRRMTRRCRKEGLIESSQDVYNFDFSSQESIGNLSTQESRKGKKLKTDGSGKGFVWKPSRVKLDQDSDPYGFNSLQESEEFKNVVEDTQKSKKRRIGSGDESGRSSLNLTKKLAEFGGFGRSYGGGSEKVDNLDKGFAWKSSSVDIDDDSDPYGFNSLEESEEFKNVVEDTKKAKKGGIGNDKKNGVFVKKEKRAKVVDCDNPGKSSFKSSKQSGGLGGLGRSYGGGSEKVDNSDKGFVWKSSSVDICEASDPYGLNSLHESEEFKNVVEGTRKAEKGGIGKDRENGVLVKKEKKVETSDSDNSGRATFKSSKQSGELEGFGRSYGGGIENLDNSDEGFVSMSSRLKLDEESDPYGFNLLQESEEFKNVVESTQKVKEGRIGDGKEHVVFVKKKGKKEKNEGSSLYTKNPTVSLMETQDSGEMMDDMDEVNFMTLDGLRKGQPVKMRRESLLSLLRSCGTAQQRQLFRAHGLAKTIMNSILGLSLDDSPSNLAAATLFYILTNDGQDDRLLSTSNCIRFIIKLLKPVTRDSGDVEPPTIGSKLLSLHMDASCSQESVNGLDSTVHAIMKKVHDILVSCKEFTLEDGDYYWNVRPEMDPKWIALLTMEKACSSRISIEDISGITFKAGGSFKEKLRELGGLDAIFEMARSCHNRMKGWSDQSKDKVAIGSLILLLKCLKIMENATFLSKNNQSHLLEMKGNFDNRPSPRSFVKLLLSVIKILSAMSLQCLSDNPVDGNCSQARRTITCNKEDRDGIFPLPSSVRSCVLGRTSSQPINVDSDSQNKQLTSSQRLSQLSSETTTTTDSNSWSLKARLDYSTSGPCNKLMVNSSDVGEDPFAFDEEDSVPSKWDFVSGSKKAPSSQSSRAMVGEHEDGPISPHMLSQQESNVMVASCSAISDQKASSLVAECLLTAVKALMNLTNDNPLGCHQIAANSGLETLSSLIIDHFSSFSLPRESSASSKASCEVNLQNDRHLSDQELDFLVAVLGLLVNLVEKDSHNRSRLASARVAPSSLKSSNEESCGDVIPLLCSIFLANQGAAEMAEEGRCLSLNDDDAISQGEKEAEKMIIEAYAALLLAFLSTGSKSIRDAIAKCLPNRSLSILVPVLERFAEFHFALNMISPETHTKVLEVIESCRLP